MEPEINNLTLHPQARPSLKVETPLYMEPEEEEEFSHCSRLGKALTFKDEKR